MMYLAADIGGTYSRFALSGDSDSDDQRLQEFDNTDFDGIESMIARALDVPGFAGQPIDRMVLAVPGPVHNDPVQLTNIDWQLHREALLDRFRVADLTVVNDFQAAALGAVVEAPETTRVLNAAASRAGPMVVAGAGTGLGMAWFPDSRDPTMPQATEGGHLDFAPVNERQLALYRWLADRYGHVSYERILSGGGLLDTYRFVAGEAATATSAAGVTAAARGNHAHALEAVHLFVEIFAAYAGNLALAFNPTAGIYLCGGVIAHLADWFQADNFLAAYAAKGRMRGVVQRIPVYLVTRRDTGLAGAVMLSLIHI